MSISIPLCSSPDSFAIQGGFPRTQLFGIDKSSVCRG
jgi:hypothetical protein